MELKDYVAETLKQIISGVKEAQTFAEGEDALINPRGGFEFRGGGKPYWAPRMRTSAIYIGESVEFDVAVTATERDQSEGGIGVIVAVFTAGVRGKEETESSAINRIKFAVPVFLPQQKKVPN